MADQDKDGVPDDQDPAPKDPSYPPKGDVAGILSAINGIGFDLNSLGMWATAPATGNKTLQTNRAMRTSGMAMGMAPSDYAPAKAPAAALTPLAATGPTGNGPSSSSQTSKSVKQYSTQQVLGLAESAFKAAVGRTATAEELATLRDHINAEEKKNPTISKSFSRSNGSGASSSSTVTSGGVDETQLAKTFAEQNPEYASYQQATTYFDAMMGALRGPAGGSI
jgi:hypothetical protein